MDIDFESIDPKMIDAEMLRYYDHSLELQLKLLERLEHDKYYSWIGWRLFDSYDHKPELQLKLAKHVQYHWECHNTEVK